MTKELIDWTHKELSITDIRKLSKLYVITITGESEGITKQPLFINEKIFKDRVESYFLKDISLINRDDILSVKWNMYITKGYYVKINDLGVIEKFELDPNKWYISYLEINGNLGSFCSVYRDKEIKTNSN